MKRLLSPSAFAFAAAVAVGIGFLLYGTHGAAGVSLGVIGAGASVLGTWLLVRMAGKSAAGSNIGFFETIFSLTGFGFKWVVVVVSMWAAYKLGPPAPGCFLGGMLLVYSRLIAQAFASV